MTARPEPCKKSTMGMVQCSRSNPPKEKHGTAPKSTSWSSKEPTPAKKDGGVLERSSRFQRTNTPRQGTPRGRCTDSFVSGLSFQSNLLNLTHDCLGFGLGMGRDTVARLQYPDKNLKSLNM